MSFGDDTLDPTNRPATRCPASREVKRLQCIGMDGHGGSHADAEGGTWENTPLSQRQPQRASPLALAASVTGHIQQALEELHELTTYQLSSATVHRHRGTVEQITKALISTRNTAAGFALILGKEGV